MLLYGIISGLLMYAAWLSRKVDHQNFALQKAVKIIDRLSFELENGEQSPRHSKIDGVLSISD